jgi:hypothetical protein
VFCAIQNPEQAGKLPPKELAGTVRLHKGDPSDNFLDSGRIAPVCKIDPGSHSGCFPIVSIQADKHMLSVLRGLAEQIGRSACALVREDWRTHLPTDSEVRFFPISIVVNQTVRQALLSRRDFFAHFFSEITSCHRRRLVWHRVLVSSRELENDPHSTLHPVFHFFLDTSYWGIQLLEKTRSPFFPRGD